MEGDYLYRSFESVSVNVGGIVHGEHGRLLPGNYQSGWPVESFVIVGSVVMVKLWERFRGKRVGVFISEMILENDNKRIAKKEIKLV